MFNGIPLVFTSNYIIFVVFIVDTGFIYDKSF